MEILIKQKEKGDLAEIYYNGKICEIIHNESLEDDIFLGYKIRMIISQNEPLNESRFGKIEKHLQSVIGLKRVNSKFLIETNIIKSKGDTLKVSCLRTHNGQSSGGFVHENTTSRILNNITEIIEKINTVFSYNKIY
jgi:hypothetical protein